MAQIRLGRYEVERGRLPKVCLRCGAPATTFIDRQFSWFPPWIYALLFLTIWPFIIIQLVLTKRMYVSVPLCAAHKNHFLWRTLFPLLGLLVVLGGLFGGVGLAAATEDVKANWKDAAIGVYFIGAGLLFLIWLVVVIVLQTNAIRPIEITDTSITLTNVSPEFVEAIEDSDRADDYRPRRSRRRDFDADEEEYDEPEPRPSSRRRGPPDDRYYEDDDR